MYVSGRRVFVVVVVLVLGDEEAGMFFWSRMMKPEADRCHEGDLGVFVGWVFTSRGSWERGRGRQGGKYFVL